MSNEPSFDDFEYPGNRASIFGQIQQIISADAMVPSFNDSLVNNFNVQYRNKETSEVISVSEVSPYPSAVVNAILRSDKRVFCGSLPLSRFLYCIVGNSIYFWSNENDPKIYHQNEDKTDTIYSVSLGLPNYDVFRKKISFVIIYSFNKGLRIIPVQDDKIYLKKGIFVKLQFNASDILTDRNGNIFLAGYNGLIYSLKYFKTTNDASSIKTSIKQLSKQSFFAPVLNLFGYNEQNKPLSSIVKFFYDEENNILASLHLNSEIRFYEYQDQKLNLINLINPFEMQEYGNQTVIDFAYSALESKTRVRFIAFLCNGDRIFFHIDPFLHIVEPSYVIRNAPFLNDVLFSATCFLNYTFLICEKSITITCGSYNINCQMENEICENVCSISFPDEDLLGFSMNIPKINSSYLFNHELFYQHIIHNPYGYLLTNNGIRTINLKTPMERIKEMFVNSKVSILNRITKSSYSIEIISSIILLASKYKQYSNSILLFLKEAIECIPNTQIGNDSQIATAFLIHVSRLIGEIWNYSVFTYEDNQYKINEEFKKFKNIDSLEQTYILCKQCLEILNDIKFKPDIQKILTLQNFLKVLIESIRLILLLIKINKNNNVLIDAFKTLDFKYQYRLAFCRFGDSYNPSLFRSLQKLIYAYFGLKSLSTVNDSFFGKLSKLCPLFFNIQDLSIIASIKNIEKADSCNRLNEELQVLCKNIERQFDLSYICTLFHEKKIL